MDKTKLKIEALFEKIANFTVKHSLFVLLATCIPITSFILTQIPKLKLDTSVDGFLLKSDVALVEYKKFKDEFGRDDLIVVGVRSNKIFSLEFLEKLRSLHEEIESIEFVEEVNSLINARSTWGDEDQLIIEDLFEVWPQTSEDLALLREKAINNPLYKNLILSPENDFTVLSIKLDTFERIDDVDGGFDFASEDLNKVELKYLPQESTDLVVLELEKIAKKYEGKDFNVFLSGVQVFGKVIKANMRKDMVQLTLGCMFLISIMLGLFFRRLSAALLPAAVTLLSLLTSLSFLSLSGVALKAPTTILPNFIIVISICSSVHFLTDFYRNYDTHGFKQPAIVHSISANGFPILLTSLTTAVSVLSFCFVKVSPVVDVGVFGALGILISLVLNLFLIPAILCISPVKRRVFKFNRLDEYLSNIGRFALDKAKIILVISFCLTLVIIFFIGKTSFSHNTTLWLNKNVKERIAVETIDEKMSGGGVLEILLDTGRINGVRDPEFLNGLKKYAESMETDNNHYGFVAGKTISIVDVLMESHKALHGNDQEYYRLAQDKNIITDELFLFELGDPDDLAKVVDSQFQVARLTVWVPSVDAISYIHFIKSAFEKSKTIFGVDVKLTFTGYMALMAKVMSSIIYSMQFSYILSFIAVSLLMILVLSSLKLGCLSMVPNLLPIMAILGLCGLLRIPMDAFLIMIGSIALGISVDDTIHYMWSVKRYLKQGHSLEYSIGATMEIVGRAILFTTIILTVGFFAYAFSSLNNITTFGLLIGLAMILALLADFFLIPALLKSRAREFQTKTRIDI
jgi:predicted RND superfamily exporter protein